MSGSRPERDPWLDGWHEVGSAVRELHTDFAESAQGVATDGQRWFVVSNRAVLGLMRKVTAPWTVFGRYRNTRRVGIYELAGPKVGEVAPDPAIWAELVGRNRARTDRAAIHLGAPAWARDCLLVPTQKPSGVWVLSHDLQRQDWWPDPAPERPERWSWVDYEPATGLLYTSLHWTPNKVQALEWQTLQRVPSADIALAATEPDTPRLDRVQGGAFAAGGRILLTSSLAGGQVYAYSARDGAFLGRRVFGDYFEMEGIAVHSCVVQGRATDIHILDASTHYVPFLKWGDNFSIRNYRVPDERY